MGLSELAKSYPAHLSGGQCQRVALARAIITQPDILLLDEPLSALDFKMRSFLQDEILKLTAHFKLTTLLVSHDIGEIYKLARRVIELKDGSVIADAPPNELFAHSNLSAKLQLNASVLSRFTHHLNAFNGAKYHQNHAFTKRIYTKVCKTQSRRQLAHL